MPNVTFSIFLQKTSVHTYIPNTHTQANIQVVCRFRPPNARERKEKKAKIVCTISDDFKFVKVDDGAKQKGEFVFDRIFGPPSSQQGVFNEVGLPLVDSLLAGYNCTLFAYGQTGSGKTWTMEGELGNFEKEGLTPRMVNEIFNKIETENSDEISFFLEISYLEIYNEKLRDLLEPKNVPRIRGGGKDGNKVILQNICEQFVSSSDEVFEYLHKGAIHRSVGATGMNAGSSRSHAVFTLKLTQKNNTNDASKLSKLLLVDLAGSEKVGKTGAKGQLLEEAKNINKSLSCLGLVMRKLSESQAAQRKGDKSSKNKVCIFFNYILLVNV